MQSLVGGALPLFAFTFGATVPSPWSFARGGSAQYVQGATGHLTLLGADAPGVDHWWDGSVFAPRGLLIEPASTNLLTRSNTFITAAWTKLNCVASAPASSARITTDQFGNTTGSFAHNVLTETADPGQHGIQRSFTPAASTAHTFSVFAGLPTGIPARDRITLVLPATGWGSEQTATFRLDTGAVVSTTGGCTAYIERWGPSAGTDHWSRCCITATSGGSPTPGSIQILANDGSGTTYDGDGVSITIIGCAQMEALGCATTWINADSTTVTRAQGALNNLSMPGTWCPTTPTTWVARMGLRRMANGGTAWPLYATEATFNDARILRAVDQSGAGWRLRASNSQPSTDYDQTVAQTVPYGSLVRVANRWRGNDCNAACDGVLGTTDASVVLTSTLTRFYIGVTPPASGLWIRSLDIYGEGFGDAELREASR
jgi:hypothetical protein